MKITHLPAGQIISFGFFLGIFFTVTSCGGNFDMAAAEAIARAQNPTYRDKPVPASVIEKLKPVIESYRQRVSEYVSDAEELQLLYKNIAVRYLDIGFYEQQIESYVAQIEALKTPPAGADARVYFDMAAVMLLQRRLYAEAYENVQKSLQLAPDNTLLLYYAGYSAALSGKAIRPEDEAAGVLWLEKAVKYYELAVEIDPDYVDALYGLSVILVYELGRSAEAIGPLLHIKKVNVANVDAMFLLAAAYYAVADYQAALREYEAILGVTTLQEKKDAASENIKHLRDLINQR